MGIYQYNHSEIITIFALYFETSVQINQSNLTEIHKRMKKNRLFSFLSSSASILNMLQRSKSLFLSALFMLIASLGAFSQTTVTLVTSGSWTVPLGVTSLSVECQGGGGGGGGASGSSGTYGTTGGGGGGGGYAAATAAVTPGLVFNYTVGTGGSAGAGGGTAVGGTGGTTTFVGTGFNLSALGGTGGHCTNVDNGNALAGTGGTGAGGTLNRTGGNGSVGTVSTTSWGGGGGGGAGNGSNGSTGGPGTGTANGGAGGSVGTGTAGGNGGTGWIGSFTGGAGTAGNIPSGGGGGAGSWQSNVSGGAGARGQVVLHYTVIVTPCSGAPSPGTATANPTSRVCSGNSVLTLTNYTTDAGITFQWYSSTNNVNFNLISGANGVSYTTPSITTTTYYYCISTCTNSGLTDTSNTASVTVIGIPPAGTAMCSPSTIACSGQSNIFLSGFSTETGILYQWYSSTNNVNFAIVPSATTTSFNSPTLTDTTYYYCTSTCPAGSNSATSTTTTVIVIQAPPVPGAITSNSPQCVGTGVTFTKGSCASGTCYWVSSATGTETSNSANTFTTATTLGTYNVWVRAYNGSCWSAAVTASGSVVAAAAAPTVGTITQPTCTLPTGSVALSGLPASGSWTINPGNIVGSGTTKNITGLAPGTYTFTVTIARGCTSPPTSNIVINAAPAVPAAPIVGTITQPTCTVGTGSVLLSGLPASGTWVINPGNMSGSGTSITLSGLTPGTNAFTVTNSAGCTSTPSSVVINPPPATPPTPVITQVGGVLYSSATTGNQWYSQSGAIGGATNQTFTITVNGDYYVIVNDGGCPSDTSNILHVTNAGIAFNEIAQAISIFPNPVTNEVNIMIDGNKDILTVEVMNTIGEVLYINKILDKLRISTENFPAGIYVLKLSNGTTSLCRKIIKE